MQIWKQKFQFEEENFSTNFGKLKTKIEIEEGKFQIYFPILNPKIKIDERSLVPIFLNRKQR